LILFVLRAAHWRAGARRRPAISAYTANARPHCGHRQRRPGAQERARRADEAVTKRLQEQKVELPSQSVLKQQVLERLILQEIQAQRAKRVG
jgi:hypothetical protein